MQWGQRNQLLQGGFNIAGDQRWCCEAFTAVHDPVTDEGHVVAVGFEFRCQPGVEHILERRIGRNAAPAVPGRGPGGIHQADFRLELPG